MAAALLAALLLAACGGSEAGDGPEETARAVFAALESGDFACPGPLFPDTATLYRYYDPQQLQGGLCPFALRDAAVISATALKGSGATPGRFEIDTDSTLTTPTGARLRFVEGTIYGANKGFGVHINRLVEVEGRWYLFVLSSHPVLSQ